MNERKKHLVRGLGLVASTSIVICSIIGTGIFLKTAVMAQLVGSPMLVMAAWITAGMLSLAGALTYAELGAMMPRAGGDYVYLGAAWGDLVAFLYGWMYITVGAAGAAALAVAFATFLAAVAPTDQVWAERAFTLFGQPILWRFGTKQIVAVTAILLCAVLNCAAVTVSGKIQSLVTAAKVAGVLVIIGGVFLFSKGTSWTHLSPPRFSGDIDGVSAFGAAMIAALWAYNGWTFLGLVAGEVRDPGKTVPRALITGTILVLAVYLLANLAYFFALPFGEILTSNSTAHRDALSVAGKAAETFLGPVGLTFMYALFMVSTIGTLHSEILVIPRIPYAMARDGLFFAAFGRLNGAGVPVFSIIFKAFWACILACSGSFDQLTTLLIFALWIFYAMTASGVFVLRRKRPDLPRPYRVTGYPMVPALFVLVALWLVINTLLTNPVESGLGVCLILLGVPLYFHFRRRKPKRPESDYQTLDTHK